MEEEKRIIVVGGGLMLHKADLLKVLGKHVDISPAFSPAHSAAYDQSHIEELQKLAKELEPAPPSKYRPGNDMRQFVRHHSRRRR